MFGRATTCRAFAHILVVFYFVVYSVCDFKAIVVNRLLPVSHFEHTSY